MKNLKMSQEGFFSKLKKRYPTLTPNDLRLCSYLRMNFTTKEIANLSNISTRAVEIARYRLRSKLGLSHDVNLTEFLIREAENNLIRPYRCDPVAEDESGLPERIS
jgi:DNA-binding CsgD family transcriptional regulator